MDYAYSRYLAAKRTVDDRALNRRVFERLRAEVAGHESLDVVEVGAGLGTMVARLIDWGLCARARYTLVDVDARLLDDARGWLSEWARGRGLRVEAGERLRIVGDSNGVGVGVGGIDWTIGFVRQALEELIDEPAVASAEVLVANAVLDLVDVGAVLPSLLARTLRPRGLCWLTINFDGETILEPPHPADAQLFSVYHRSMDERRRDGRSAGDSRTGRHLFAHLRAAGATLLEAGASDWVVFPDGDGRYPADEREFLRAILVTVDDELRRHADVDRATLAAWLAERTAQLEAGALTLIAHQLDFLGRVEP